MNAQVVLFYADLLHVERYRQRANEALGFPRDPGCRSIGVPGRRLEVDPTSTISTQFVALISTWRRLYKDEAQIKEDLMHPRNIDAGSRRLED